MCSIIVLSVLRKHLLIGHFSFSPFFWSPSIGKPNMTPVSKQGTSHLSSGGAGCVFVVVAVGWGGHVHFYLIHIFTNLPVSPGSFGPLK